MAKKIELQCIESVYLKVRGHRAFTEGKEYTARERTVPNYMGDMVGSIRVLQAENDQLKNHTLKRMETDELDDFYRKHFKEI